MKRICVRVQYVCSLGGAGSDQLFLDELPGWLERTKKYGTWGNVLIHTIVVLK